MHRNTQQAGGLEKRLMQAQEASRWKKSESAADDDDDDDDENEDAHGGRGFYQHLGKMPWAQSWGVTWRA